jgi:hypothetical protein
MASALLGLEAADLSHYQSIAINAKSAEDHHHHHHHGVRMMMQSEASSAMLPIFQHLRFEK